MGEENSIQLRLMIQRTGQHTSTKNLQEYLQLQHRFYPSCPQSVFIPSPQSLFSTQFLFYTQSLFSSFITSPYLIPSPQSVVRSPCFILTSPIQFRTTLHFLFSRRNIELKTSKHKFTDRSHQNKRDFEGKKLSGTDFTSFQTMAHLPNCIYCFLTSIFEFVWLVILQNPSE